MRFKLVAAILGLAVLTAVVAVDSQQAAQATFKIKHKWDYEIGDSIRLPTGYYIVWKRMEALHPDNMELYYYYQIALEGSMIGHWVWEDDLDLGSMPLTGGDPEDPRPPATTCPPFYIPPPCPESN